LNKDLFLKNVTSSDQIEWFEHLWEKDEMLEIIKKQKHKIKALSVDIFDTLVFRTCIHPKDLFLEVGKQAIESHILRSGITPHEFQQIRIVAEDKARTMKKKCKQTIEVSLEDIYNCMPMNIGDRCKLQLIELDVEKQFSYLNPSIMSLITYFKQLNIPIILSSDMYLSSSQIKEILDYVGFPLEWIDLLLISNEVGGGKSSGYLFEKLMEHYPEILPPFILHVGDNLLADVEGAKKVGISFIHYSVVPTNMHTLFELEQVCYGRVLSEINSLRKLTYHLSNFYTEEKKIWFQFGSTVLGPFLSIFSDWIIDICIKENKKAIYPFMREGKLLATLLKNAAENKALEIKIEPIYISRQATALPAMERMDKENIENLFLRKNFKVKNLFEILNIQEHLTEFEAYKEVFLHNSHNVFLKEKYSLKNALIDFLFREDKLEKINNHIKYTRQLFIDYIQQMCDDLEDIVTVDIGYKGTIPKFMEEVFAILNIKTKITHLLAIGAEETKDLLSSGIDIRGFSGNSGQNWDLIKTILRVTEPIEQLMNINDGSTIGYKRLDDGTIAPIIEKSHVTAKEAEMKKICHEGVIEFQKLWFYLCESKPYIRQELINNGRELLKLLHRFISMPTFEEAMEMGNLSVDENYGSDYVSKLCTEDQQKIIKQIGIEKFLRKCRYGIKEKDINYRNIYWPQALVTRQDPYYFVRRQLQYNEQSGYLNIMSDMILQILEEGINEIIIYGAGEAGKYLLRAAQLYGMNVKYFVDRKESLWGTYIEGIEVISLNQAVRSGIRTYAIGSMAFIDEIRSNIEQIYSTVEEKPSIFTIQL